MNYRMISYVWGWILIFEAAFLLVPSVAAMIYDERQSLIAFIVTLAVCLAIGVMFSCKRPKNTELSAKEGFIVVAFSWILLSFFGSFPFLISGTTDSFVNALFETVSGFTTTGATIFTDVEVLPRSIIIWRSFTHWVGGMGVLVFVMAFIRLSGAQNMYIMKAESPGPEVSKLVPKVKTTAIWLYVTYLVLTVVLGILLLCGGESLFDSINIALSTAGTGGFGFLNDSLASYSSYTQIVVTVFMVLFSINFGSYFLLFKGKLRAAFTTEVKTFLCIVIVFSLCIAVNISGIYQSFGEALKHSFFSVSSLISTTGFATADFNTWPVFSKTLLVLVMFVGACAGSTGGGIKVSRVVIMFKVMIRELSTALRPKQVKKVTVDGQVQDLSIVKAVYGYIFCYISVFVLSTVLISLDGNPKCDLVTNFTAITSAMSNVGPGLANVGPIYNYEFFSPLSKLVLIFDMLAGRLEFYPMLLLLVPSTWRK